jgi:hypothetical protein
LSCTPETLTDISLRGKENLITPPGFGVPLRPSARSTDDQSLEAGAAVCAIERELMSDATVRTTHETNCERIENAPF